MPRTISTVWTAAVLIAAAACAQESAVEDPADSVDVAGKRIAVAELSREDVERLTYDDLIAMPFEVLVGIADKLEISVDELLSMKMSVASKKSTTIREQPGILSAITREEILRSGARELSDVLRMVPGIWFGQDVEGVMGISMRGNWAHEGKVLMLIDGMMMNELRYASTPIEQHYAVDNIKRIEIIRGPGSAMYGGFAELGVINIVTLQGDDYRGLAGSRSIGLMGKSTDDGLDVTYGHNRTWFGFGAQKGPVEFSLSGTYADGHRSDEEIVTLYLETDDTGAVVYDSNGNSTRLSEDFKSYVGQIGSFNVNSALRVGDFRARFMYDQTSTYAVDAGTYVDFFTNYMADLRYDLKLAGGSLTLTPSVSYKSDIGWWSKLYYNNLQVIRYNGQLAASWEPNTYLSLNGGVAGYVDRGRMINDWDSAYGTPNSSDDTLMFNNEESVWFWNAMGYLQGVGRLPKIGLSLTLGGRYELHEIRGDAFSPRVGLTQVLGNFHYKLLYSRSFRTPSMGPIEYDQKDTDEEDIKPDKADVVELELGYRFGKHIFLTLNAFDITLREPISYWAGETTDGYLNAGRLGSTGGEAVLTVKYPRIGGTLTYAYYSANNKPKNEIDSVFVPVPDDEELGTSRFDQPYYAAPQHKVTLSVTAEPLKGLFVTPSMVVASRVYATTDLDEETEDGVPVTTGMDPTVLLNLFVRYEDFLAKGLAVNVGVHDILDSDPGWAQAYNGWEIPYPGTGRELFLKVDYSLSRRR